MHNGTQEITSGRSTGSLLKADLGTRAAVPVKQILNYARTDFAVTLLPEEGPAKESLATHERALARIIETETDCKEVALLHRCATELESEIHTKVDRDHEVLTAIELARMAGFEARLLDDHKILEKNVFANGLPKIAPVRIDGAPTILALSRDFSNSFANFSIVSGTKVPLPNNAGFRAEITLEISELVRLPNAKDWLEKMATGGKSTQLNVNAPDFKATIICSTNGDARLERIECRTEIVKVDRLIEQLLGSYTYIPRWTANWSAQFDAGAFQPALLAQLKEQYGWPNLTVLQPLRANEYGSITIWCGDAKVNIWKSDALRASFLYRPMSPIPDCIQRQIVHATKSPYFSEIYLLSEVPRQEDWQLEFGKLDMDKFPEIKPRPVPVPDPLVCAVGKSSKQIYIIGQYTCTPLEQSILDLTVPIKA